jgi:early secretory antigenic target protein ESAT-6
MSDALSYNFGGIDGAAGDITRQVSTIQGLLDQGGACVQKLASIWGGAGSESYQATQQRWDSTAAELNAALSDLSNKVGEAGSSMLQS